MPILVETPTAEGFVIINLIVEAVDADIAKF
jgi:hypothetical protein